MAIWKSPSPYSLLKVRVDAIFKRYYDTGRIFSYKDARVDFESYSASLAGQEVAINAKELEILDYLVKNEDEPDPISDNRCRMESDR